MKVKRRIHKFQRQNFEYKRQLGKKLINEEYNRMKDIITKNNKKEVNRMFISNVRSIKRVYNVTNIGKAEKCWTHFYNNYR